MVLREDLSGDLLGVGVVVEIGFLLVPGVIVVDFEAVVEIFSIAGATTTFFGRPRFLATASGVLDMFLDMNIVFRFEGVSYSDAFRTKGKNK